MIYRHDGVRIRPAAGFVSQWLRAPDQKKDSADAVASQAAGSSEEPIEICAAPSAGAQ